MKNLKKILGLSCTAGLMATLLVALGCGNSTESDDHGHSHDDGEAHSHDTSTAAPHGGTPVLIADDKFHLELVLDTSKSEIQAHVLDGHLEGYVPVTEMAFVIVATVDGEEQQLNFERKTSSSNPDTPSSVFVARANWLESAEQFSGRIPLISLNGQEFNDVAFEFPEGSKHVH